MISVKELMEVKVSLTGMITFNDEVTLRKAVEELVEKELQDQAEVFIPLRQEHAWAPKEAPAMRMERTNIKDLTSDEISEILQDYYSPMLVKDIRMKHNLSAHILYDILEVNGSPRRIMKGFVMKLSKVKEIKQRYGKSSNVTLFREYKIDLKQLNAIIKYNDKVHTVETLEAEE